MIVTLALLSPAQAQVVPPPLFKIGINGAACAFNDLPSAVAAASKGDTIYIGADLTGGDAQLPSTGWTGDDLTIRSATSDCAASTTTKRELDLRGGVFGNYANRSLTLWDLSITNGDLNVLTARQSGSLVIESCSFSDNNKGDVVTLVGHTSLIRGTSFVNNDGIAIVAALGSLVSVQDDDFDGNVGAMHVEAASTATVSNCDIRNHVGPTALRVTDAGSLLGVSQCYVQDNATGGSVFTAGTAAYASNEATLLLDNVLVTGNPKVAILVENAMTSLSMTQATVADNRHGVHVTDAATATIDNSIIQENHSDNGIGSAAVVDLTCSNSQGWTGSGTVNVVNTQNASPLFAADYQLTATSPSIDQCTNGVRPDLLGNPVSGDYDQGAFEF